LLFYKYAKCHVTNKLFIMWSFHHSICHKYSICTTCQWYFPNAMYHGRCQVESTILQSVNKPLCHCLKYIRPLVMLPILIFHDHVDFSKKYFHLHYLYNMKFNLHLSKTLKRILYLNYIKKLMKSYKSQRKYF